MTGILVRLLQRYRISKKYMNKYAKGFIRQMKSKLGESTVVACMLESQKIWQQLSPRSSIARGTKDTARVRGGDSEAARRAASARVYQKPVETEESRPQAMGKVGALPKCPSFTLVFFLLPRPGYQIVGWCSPHLEWILLFQFAGLHASQPQTHPELCPTNLLVQFCFGFCLSLETVLTTQFRRALNSLGSPGSRGLN